MFRPLYMAIQVHNETSTHRGALKTLCYKMILKHFPRVISPISTLADDPEDDNSENQQDRDRILSSNQEGYFSVILERLDALLDGMKFAHVLEQDEQVISMDEVT